ncbi:MAG: type VI secretion system baseplate subunit TssG [Pseudomonadota bacterium]
MPASQWRANASVIDQLLAEPHRFEFFQALRLIDMCLTQADTERGPSLSDLVRVRNRLSLAFPASEIEALSVEVEDGGADAVALLQALQEGSPARIDVTPAFMGLLGGNGALPLHYSERIAAHEQKQGDEGARDFLDMFTQPALSMFYQAWTKHRPECLAERRGADAFLSMLLALAGANAPAANELINEETFGCYAAQARSRNVSSAVMAGVLAEYFCVPFEVEQLLDDWDALPPENQARLGVGNVSLGDGFLLGERIYRCDTRVGLRIGPLDRDELELFLPGRSSAQCLERMLGMYCGVGLIFEVHLILRRQDVTGFALTGSDAPGGARLGVDVFLLDGVSSDDRDDLSYFLYP